MTLPDFFNQAPKITLRDPLAQFLGATPDGLLTYPAPRWPARI